MSLYIEFVEDLVVQLFKSSFELNVLVVEQRALEIPFEFFRVLFYQGFGIKSVRIAIALSLFVGHEAEICATFPLGFGLAPCPSLVSFGAAYNNYK